MGLIVIGLGGSGVARGIDAHAFSTVVASALEARLAVIAKDGAASAAFKANNDRSNAASVDALALTVVAVWINAAGIEGGTVEIEFATATGLIAIGEHLLAHARGTKAWSLWEDAGSVRLALWCT